MKHWFLPEVPDLLARLREQADITTQGMVCLTEWSQGDETAERTVRDAERRADEAKRKVLRGLRVAFSTPLDPEDIYELAERLGLVMSSAKNIVREAEVMAMGPDRHMAAMAEQLGVGQGHLGEAIRALGRDDDEATSASDEAMSACRELEHLYRLAMSELLAVPDLREVMGRRELYRRYSRSADAIGAVSERVWYAVVKSP